MQIIRFPDPKDFDRLLARPVIDKVTLESDVRKILEAVKAEGDEAVRRFTLSLDKISSPVIQIGEEDFIRAEKNISEELKASMKLAKDNVEKFHRTQRELPQEIEIQKGVTCWRKSIAIERVGLYIPGGSAPLFSTVLMLGVPAAIAGCKEIILCTPPSKDGLINPAILYAARLVGIKKVFCIGGAQAIGAMAYGTKTVPRVYKIFGPGNQYVTAAKKLVNADGVSIDMPAGPSELAILADRFCVPAFVAADLLSQAEHGTDSQVILVSDEEEIISCVNSELKSQLELLPRKDIAAKALQNSKVFLVGSMEDGMNLINAYAPEHLILACKDSDKLAEKVVNAGSVFLGNYSCESAGDYASGTNHTLPTNGFARAYSGVSLDSFLKKVTFQRLTEEGLMEIGKAIEIMAEAEGLQAHKNAVSIRLKKS